MVIGFSPPAAESYDKDSVRLKPRPIKKHKRSYQQDFHEKGVFRTVSIHALGEPTKMSKMS